MKIYKTQAEVEKDIKDGILTINDDVTFECSIDIEADIRVRDINARGIRAKGIRARDINAWDINAKGIRAKDINAWDINADDINADDINADYIISSDIRALGIIAWNITATDISYYAFCNVYNSIKCTSIKARREKHAEPVCLDGQLEIITKEEEKPQRNLSK